MSAKRLSKKEEELFSQFLGSADVDGPLLFGRFLSLQGLISDEDVFNARMLQKTQNRRLGEIAIERGFLQPEEVQRLLIWQEEYGIRFGELAVEFGYLTGEQLQEILSQAQSSYLYFGEALVMLGVIQQNIMLSNLAMFHRFKLIKDDGPSS